MNSGRITSIVLSVALHAGVLWWYKPQDSDVPLAAGDPAGESVEVDLVDPGPIADAVAPQEPLPEPLPEEPPPEPMPPEPEPEPVAEPPPPPPPDAMEEPAPVEPPKPQPTPKPRPAVKPAIKPPPVQSARTGTARAASSPMPAGFVPGASAGGAVGESRARYKHRVKPAYPESLRRTGASGRVSIVVVVSPQGRPISARVSQSSGNALFDQAALTAARSSEFYPKKAMGVPVQDTVLIPYRFEIEN